MTTRNSNSMARQRGAIKRYYENSNRIPNVPRCPDSKSRDSHEENELVQAQIKIVQLESQVSELETKLQRLNENNLMGGEYMSEMSKEGTHWRKLCDEREDIISELQTKLKINRERARERNKEIETEVKWQQKKIKMLEQTIEKNNEARILNQQLYQEQVHQLQKTIENLEKERQNQQYKSEQDLIEIQNLENAVKHLHDENVLLKETPIRVIVPPRPTITNRNEQTFYTYKTNGRPVAPQVSLLDQMAAERQQHSQSNFNSPSRSYANSQPNSYSNSQPHSNSNSQLKTSNSRVNSQSQWPYSASEEDLFWGR